MNLKKLLKLDPKFHTCGDGKKISHRISTRLLQFLDTQLSKGINTLETGAGTSTVLFAINKCNHTCITPNQNETQKIKQFCKHYKLNKVNMITQQSEEILPNLKTKKLDLILIDGRHAFPSLH